MASHSGRTSESPAVDDMTTQEGGIGKDIKEGGVSDAADHPHPVLAVELDAAVLEVGHRYGSEEFPLAVEVWGNPLPTWTRHSPLLQL